MFGAFRKTIGLFLIAFGIGAVVALFLPLWLWVIIVAGRSDGTWIYLAILLGGN